MAQPVPVPTTAPKEDIDDLIFASSSDWKVSDR